MNRYILVGPLLLFVALALAACGSDTSPAAAPGTATHDTAWVIGLLDAKQTGGELETPARVILEYSDTTAVYVPLVVSSPPATNTPVPTVTLTPPPTNTPRPTATPTASRTPDIEPSPTQEGDGTPITPVPTLPPVEEPGCYGAVTVSALTIRTAPATVQDGQVILAPSKGQYWRNGERIRITRVVYVPVTEGRLDEWIEAYRDERQGWSAAYWDRISYVIYENTDECNYVRWGTEQPARELTGFHLIVGASNAVAGYSDRIGTMKATTHTADIARAMKIANPNIYIVYRSLHTQRGMVDCPEVWQWTSTSVYWSELKSYLEPGFDWFEFENECSPPDWQSWEKHSIEMLTYMARDGYCGLFGSFGPGWPPQEAWPHVLNVMRWIDTHPCSVWPDGSPKYHGQAYHMTGRMPPGVYVPPGSYLLEPWITDRDVIYNAWLLLYGYSMEQFKGPVFITELGWSDYSIPNYVFSCEETAKGWAFTRADYISRRPWITGVHIWTLTRDGDPRFTNLTPCLPQIFAALH